MLQFLHIFMTIFILHLFLLIMSVLTYVREFIFWFYDLQFTKNGVSIQWNLSKTSVVCFKEMKKSMPNNHKQYKKNKLILNKNKVGGITVIVLKHVTKLWLKVNKVFVINIHKSKYNTNIWIHMYSHKYMYLWALNKSHLHLFNQ